MSVFILRKSNFILYLLCMKNNYSRGSVGGIILIVVGIILCCLLLGVLVKTYKNSSFSSTFVPTQAVAPQSSSTTTAQTVPSKEFVSPTSDCQMVVTEPDDDDNVSIPVYFSGYLRGCGSVTAQMLIGSLTLYRYGTAESLAPALSLKASRSVTNGDVPFSGYLDIPESSSRIEKGILKFKHFLPSGGTDTINRIIYF